MVGILIHRFKVFPTGNICKRNHEKIRRFQLETLETKIGNKPKKGSVSVSVPLGTWKRKHSKNGSILFPLYKIPGNKNLSKIECFQLETTGNNWKQNEVCS
jgi:hypothetical protein